MDLRLAKGSSGVVAARELYERHALRCIFVSAPPEQHSCPMNSSTATTLPAAPKWETLSHELQEAFIYVYYRGRMNGVKEIRDLSDAPPKARSQGRCGGELSSPHGRCF